MPPLSSHGSALALQEQRLLEEASQVHHHRGVHGGAQGSVLPPEAPPVSIHPTVSPAPPALDRHMLRTLLRPMVGAEWAHLGPRVKDRGPISREVARTGFLVHEGTVSHKAHFQYSLSAPQGQRVTPHTQHKIQRLAH